MNVYRFKVSLFYNKRTYRQIDILGHQTLEDFHKIIFHAFDRFAEHLYSFFLTRTPQKSIRKIYEAPEFCESDDFQFFLLFRRKDRYDVLETQIDFLELKEKDKMYYLFDYGDSWWHEITLLSMCETDEKKDFPKIVKIVGESPEQYGF